MAFADDIILLARDQETAIGQLKYMHQELRSRRMALSVEKSFAFEYIPRNKIWYVRDPKLTVGEVPVPYGESENSFKYLGHAVGGLDFGHGTGGPSRDPRTGKSSPAQAYAKDRSIA